MAEMFVLGMARKPSLTYGHSWIAIQFDEGQSDSASQGIAP